MYCPNCGHELPDGAKFCSNCGASIDTGRQEQVEYHENLKFQQNMVDRSGNRIGVPDYADRSREGREKKNKSQGKGLFVVLCIAIAVLAAGIAWEVISLVKINQSTNQFTLPKLQSESTVMEADSSLSGTDSVRS